MLPMGSLSLVGGPKTQKSLTCRAEPGGISDDQDEMTRRRGGDIKGKDRMNGSWKKRTSPSVSSRHATTTISRHALSKLTLLRLINLLMLAGSTLLPTWAKEGADGLVGPLGPVAVTCPLTRVKRGVKAARVARVGMNILKRVVFMLFVWRFDVERCRLKRGRGHVEDGRW